MVECEQENCSICREQLPTPPHPHPVSSVDLMPEAGVAQVTPRSKVLAASPASCDISLTLSNTLSQGGGLPPGPRSTQSPLPAGASVGNARHIQLRVVPKVPPCGDARTCKPALPWKEAWPRPPPCPPKAARSVSSSSCSTSTKDAGDAQPKAKGRLRPSLGHTAQWSIGAVPGRGRGSPQMKAAPAGGCVRHHGGQREHPRSECAAVRYHGTKTASQETSAFPKAGA